MNGWFCRALSTTRLFLSRVPWSACFFSINTFLAPISPTFCFLVNKYELVSRPLSAHLAEVDFCALDARLSYLHRLKKIINSPWWLLRIRTQPPGTIVKCLLPWTLEFYIIAGLFSQLFGQINTAGTMRGKLNKYSKTADRHYPRFRNNVYMISP